MKNEKAKQENSNKEKKPLILSFREIGLPKLLLMLGAGLILILLSIPDIFQNTNSKKNNAVIEEGGNETKITGLEDNEEYVGKLEEKLESVLADVKGVGRVKVMITLSTSKEKVTLKDNPTNSEETTETDSAGGSREQKKLSKEEQSVLVEGENGSVPYVLKENEPIVEGILIVAQGGGDILVQNEIIGAVEVLFNVPKHKIKVMKMDFE